jgi:hypothetical protein
LEGLKRLKDVEGHNRHKLQRNIWQLGKLQVVAFFVAAHKLEELSGSNV